jgi:hypothetical protein
MKSPDTEWQELRARLAPLWAGTYSDSQWQAVRDSLAAVGIDLDVATLDLELLCCGVARVRGLDEMLQRLAWWYALAAAGVLQRKTREGRQRVLRLQTELATFEAALAVLDNAKHEFHLGITDELRAAAHGVLHDELTDLIARLRWRIDQLTERDPSSRSSANARKPHREFWTELTRLWLALTADRPRREYLLEFLFACSSPIFPAETINSALTSFTESKRIIFPQTNS